MSTALQQPTRHERPLAEPAADHLFVNNVRFLSMAGVVSVHCISTMFSLSGLSSLAGLERWMRQPVSFDVIGFFLISGFLMEEGLRRRTPAEYLKRRLKRIVAPWMFWYSLYFVIILANDAMHGRIAHLSWREGALFAFHTLLDCLFTSAYWFVPNLLLALCVLLACRRFSLDLWIGWVFLALSLFYGLNIHAHWIPIQDHTEALLGFVLYLWLGMWAARNFDAIQSWTGRIGTPVLLALAALAALAALWESSVLFAAGDHHSMNTLRLCNQAYSILIVLAIFRLRRPIWPRAANVRATTFGIYLIHPIVLWIIRGLIKRSTSGAVASLSWGWAAAAVICLSLCFFAVIYGTSLSLTSWLLDHPRLRWLVGAPSSS